MKEVAFGLDPEWWAKLCKVKMGGRALQGHGTTGGITRREEGSTTARKGRAVQEAEEQEP